MYTTPPPDDEQDELPVIFNPATMAAGDTESLIDESYLANIVLEFPPDIEPLFNPATTEAAEDEIDEAENRE